jgi:PAS domain S-box-containing protein
MHTAEKNKKVLIKKVESLTRKLEREKKLEQRLKLKDKKLKQLVQTLEERVENRTAAERIINKQLHIEIEQRKQLEAELYKVKQFLENIVNGITEQIILVSKDFKILWANKTFLDQFGCKIEDVAGRRCYEVTHNQNTPCQPPHDICPIAQVLETGKAIKEVHVHRRAAGEFYSEVTAYPIRDEKGNIVEFVHIAREVMQKKSERKEGKSAVQ